MATINQNVKQKQVARTGTAPRLPDDFGQAPIRAAGKLVSTAGALAKQGGEINEAYAVKNKRADMLSDRMKYDIAKQTAMDKANLEAANTTNIEEVEAIYTRAKDSLSGYAMGKNDDKIPNVRWKDQVQSIKDDNAGFVVNVERAKLTRLADLSMRESIATSELATNYAVRNWDKPAIRASIEPLVEAGHLTRSEADKAIVISEIKADKMLAKSTAEAIASQVPEQARKNAADAIANIDNLDSLTDTEKQEVTADLNKAVQLSEYYDRRDLAAAKKAANASSYALVKGAVESFDNPKLASQNISVAFPELTNRTVKAQGKRMAMKNPEDDGMRRSLEWHNWAKRMGDYDKADDKDAKKLAELYIEAQSFGGYGERSMALLSQSLKGGSGQLVAGDVDVIRGMINTLTDDYIKTLDGLPADFVDKYGGTATKPTISDIDQRLFGLVMRVVKDGNMDRADAVDYIQSDPLYQGLRDGIDVNILRRRLKGIEGNDTPVANPITGK